MAGDILLGVVIGAQGLGGEVKVKTFTTEPERLAAYGVLRTRDGRRFEVESVRPSKQDIAVVRLAGIGDRSAAEALKGIELVVARDALPMPANEEYYHADLVGLRAQDAEGRHIGDIRAIHNHGAGDVLELVRDDGNTLLLPFSREFVPTIDIAGGYVVVAEPEDNEALEQRGVE
ncbi:MAG TPA: ribosome maturation factor RimM [Rhizomicrobium sp.]|jgi:16S rRNA processing protein RimM